MTVSVDVLTWLIWTAVVISAFTPILLLVLVFRDWQNDSLW